MEKKKRSLLASWKRYSAMICGGAIIAAAVIGAGSTRNAQADFKLKYKGKPLGPIGQCEDPTQNSYGGHSYCLSDNVKAELRYKGDIPFDYSGEINSVDHPSSVNLMSAAIKCAGTSICVVPSRTNASLLFYLGNIIGWTITASYPENIEMSEGIPYGSITTIGAYGQPFGSVDRGYDNAVFWTGKDFYEGQTNSLGTWTMEPWQAQLDAGLENVGDDPQCPSSLIGDPINAATGNKIEAETDYAGAGSAAGLTLTRYYNSVDRTATPFGYGWRSTWHRNLIQESASTVKIVREDGRVDTFTQNSSGAWTTDANVTSTLVAVKNSGGTQTGWRLTRDDDSKEAYSLSGRLESISARDSRVVTQLGYDGDGRLATVTDAFGHVLAFAYNSDGSIDEVTLPDGEEIGYGHDNKGNLTTINNPDGTTRTYLYENTAFPHALTGIIDENGTRYETTIYDSLGLATDTHNNGGANGIVIEYNSDGSASFKDANGNENGLLFSDLSGLLKPASMTNDCCGGAEYTYDPNGFLASITDFNGDLTLITNNERGLEISRTEAVGTPEQRTTLTDWHPTFRLPSKITEGSRVTGFTYDDFGNLSTKTITADGKTRTWGYGYNTSSQLTQIDGPRTDVADITTYAYDTDGNLATITNALGHVTKITEYDDNGNPLVIIDPNGLETTLAYDERGRIISHNVGGEETTYDYDDAGLLKKVTLPDASYLLYGYDGAHRLTSITDAAENQIVYTLDGNGNVIKENTYGKDGALARTRGYAYDALNRIIKTISAKGLATTYERDGEGNVTGVIDPLGNVVGNTFDALDRLVKTVDPMGATATVGHNRDDQPTSVTDPIGVGTTYGYNGLGDAIRTTSPDAGETTNVYDDAGNLTQTTDALGQTLTYGYDALNRLTSVTPSNGTAITYEYDNGENAIGRMTSMTDASGMTQWAYDLHGRVTQKTQTIDGQQFVTSMKYNGNGQLKEMTYPSGRTVGYDYDSKTGLLSEIAVDGETYISNITYAPFGAVAGWQLANGDNYKRGYDTDGRLAEIVMGRHGNVTISYDDASRITGMGGTALSAKTFAYDRASRLTNYTMDGKASAYGYDLNGNRIEAKNGSDVTTCAYEGNILTEMLGAQSELLTHNDAGAITGMGGLSLDYNGYTQLAGVAGDGVSVGYAYNGQGQRVIRTGTDGGKTYYVNDGTSLMGEYSGAGSPIKETIWLPGQNGGTAIPVLVVDKDSKVYDVFSGHLNEPVIVAAQSGDKVWKWDHDPFGTTAPQETFEVGNGANLGSNGNGSGGGGGGGCFISSLFSAAAAEAADATTTFFEYNLRFPGQVFDKETNLSYNNARVYDPATGRYTQSDPIGLNGGLNRFAYVGGNPVMGVDPEGLQIAIPVISCLENPVCLATVGGSLVWMSQVFSSTNHQIAQQNMDSYRLPSCDPPPAAGSECYEENIGHLHNDWDPHYHLWARNQNPSTGQCFWNRGAGTSGTIPLRPQSLPPCNTFPSWPNG